MSAQKANLLAANLRKKLEQEPKGSYRFITLTLRHTDAPLKQQIKRLYTSFQRLRKDKLWKNSQTGGIVILEVKWSKDTGQWHPHLHVISDGGYIQKSDLSNKWNEITGDSSIVDIKLLSAEKDAAHYLAKYVSKGTNNEVWQNEGAAEEWTIAMKGVRSATTFGTWRAFKLLARTPDSGTWVRVDSLNALYRRAAEGEEHAKHLIVMLFETLAFDPGRKKGHHRPDA